MKYDHTSSSVEACIEDIGNGVRSSMVKLNLNQVKSIMFSSKQRVKRTENLEIRAVSNYIIFENLEKSWRYC